MAAVRGLFASLRDYFLPPPIEPVNIPVVLKNGRPLTEEETAEIRRGQAKAIDKYFDEELDKENYDELNNKSRSLQWMPDITPQDPLWQRTRAYYAQLLKTEKISDVLDDHFEEIQKILINPQAWSNEVQAVRDQQSRDYYENIGPTGPFDGQLDNLATKMTMVHFGLPVAPMTLNNIMILTPDWKDSEDDEEDPAPSPPRQQRIIYSEKPLEFLDSYLERAFGYQIIRRPRVSMRGGAGSVDELSLAGSSDFKWGTTVNMRGGAGNEPALRGYYLDLLGPSPEYRRRRTHLTQDEFLTSAHELLECPEGSDWPFNVDVYRQPDPRKIDIPLQISVQIDSIVNFVERWPEIEEIIGKVDHDQLTIIIQQERLSHEHAPQYYEDPVRLAREFPDEHKKVSRHLIYSYFGKREITPRYFAFKDAVTKLLNIDPTSNWSFFVDVHLQDRILPPIRFTRSQYRNDFLSLRDQYLLGTDANKASIFVRNVCGYAPSQMSLVEPPIENIQIIRLISESDRTETYWKVPLDLSTPYCLNSLQPSFVRAFLAIFGRDRPSRNVRLSNTRPGGKAERAIGFGGMEVTLETWDWVVEQIEQQKHNPPQAGAHPRSCQLILTVPPVTIGIRPGESLTLRLIGDDYPRDTEFRRNDYLHIYDYILERLRKLHRTRQNSTYPNGSSIAMWFSAIEREKNYPPVILQVDARDYNTRKIRKLQEAFSGRLQTFSNIWFRPEYRVFTIHDAQQNTLVWQWNTTDEQHDTSLENFRANVREMYDDWDPALDSNFVIIQPRGNHLFAVDQKTSENYWRKYIFDWFTETDVYIERRGVRPFMQPDIIPWGYRHNRPTSAAPPVDLNPEPVAPIVDPSQQPRINKTRLVLPVAEKTITPKWETWMTDQHRKDALQRSSYIQDQSVIEPGLDPSAPTYGPSKELTLGVSLSTPTVYIQRLTPTDILHLAEENQKLRNGLLERSHNCNICSISMAGYENAEIQRHYAQHLIQLQKEGQCPLCERESWSIMTMEQKKEHLETHQVEADIEMIRNFWNGIECPVCDAKLSGFTAEQVLRHMADHLPGIVEFCDKCGLRTAICTEAELVHHRYTCLDKPDRGPLDPEPLFCRDCGQNRTDEDEQERGLHVVNCTAKNRRNQDKKFCTKCGIDKSAWSKDEIATHDDHCTSPQGLQKEFCLRCGTKLLGLNESQLIDHRVYCAIRTKESETLKQRIEELKIRTADTNRVSAKTASTLAWLTKREINLAENERVLAERESRLPQTHRPVISWAEDRRDLGKCPWSATGCDFYTVGRSRDEIFTHMASHFDPKQPRPFACPFPGCGKRVAAPGSDSGNDLHIVDHYRHRDGYGISDVRSVPKGFKAGTARDPNKLKELMEHFQRANAMNTLTAQRNLTPIPTWGEGLGDGGGSGGGTGSQKFGSDALKTGYAYQKSWLLSEDEQLQQSIEADDLLYHDDENLYENLFEPGDYEPQPVKFTVTGPTPKKPTSLVELASSPELDSSSVPQSTTDTGSAVDTGSATDTDSPVEPPTPAKPETPGQPPILPYSPTKRKASAAIPEEELTPYSTRRASKRFRRAGTDSSSPETESEEAVRRSPRRAESSQQNPVGGFHRPARKASMSKVRFFEDEEDEEAYAKMVEGSTGDLKDWGDVVDELYGSSGPSEASLSEPEPAPSASIQPAMITRARARGKK
ncbi:hypothetical protein SBOR_8528 [Sclerotinia borealis F-4128]|uniref:C2H2-type domain-containing protein n=1 Tax=Sclerotinia borealis (strain F-4128) TaxID=1432307 RepID=W9C936_SCLBF|nr:hypothetical protein SBOR_8528 [Sclerotinia borealis F-4128]